MEKNKINILLFLLSSDNLSWFISTSLLIGTYNYGPSIVYNYFPTSKLNDFLNWFLTTKSIQQQLKDIKSSIENVTEITNSSAIETTKFFNTINNDIRGLRAIDNAHSDIINKGADHLKSVAIIASENQSAVYSLKLAYKNIQEQINQVLVKLGTDNILESQMVVNDLTVSVLKDTQMLITSINSISEDLNLINILPSNVLANRQNIPEIILVEPKMIDIIEQNRLLTNIGEKTATDTISIWLVKNSSPFFAVSSWLVFKFFVVTVNPLTVLNVAGFLLGKENQIGKKTYNYLFSLEDK